MKSDQSAHLFEDRVVIVTGAGRGLGRAHARFVAALGATVVVNDAGVAQDGSGPDPSVARDAAAAIEAAGARTMWSAADLSSRAECHQLVAETLERFGRVDALIHSAGIVDRHPIAEITEEQLARTLAVNLGAAVWLVQAALPAMRSKRYGRIVLTISGHGLFPIDPPALPAYATGKAAQFGLMNTLAMESAADGILINAVAPVAATRVYTGPNPERFRPDLTSPGVAFLASELCQDFGLVLRAAGGEFSVGGYAVTPGVLFPGQPSFSKFVAHWSEIAGGHFQPANPPSVSDRAPRVAQPARPRPSRKRPRPST